MTGGKGRPPPWVTRGRVPQIDSYEKLYEEVSKRENTRVFSGWLQCDCRPFKQALLNAIRRWGFMFKQHLTSHVISRWAPVLPRPHLDRARGEPDRRLRGAGGRGGAPAGQAWGEGQHRGWQPAPPPPLSAVWGGPGGQAPPSGVWAPWASWGRTH